MCQCRAAQVAMVPLSQVRMASSAASSSSTLTRNSGAIGSRFSSCSAAIFSRHLPICFWYFSRNDVSDRCLSSGSRACRPSRASPTTGTSVGTRAPARAGSASICTIRALPGSGMNLVYGKLVPTMNRVSRSSISSSDGAVPSRPIPPVVYGESSGTVALPDSVLMIGAPSVSATASNCSRACRAPAPARIATFSPAFSTSASRCRSSSLGRPGAASRIGAVAGVRAGPTSA